MELSLPPFKKSIKVRNSHQLSLGSDLLTYFLLFEWFSQRRCFSLKNHGRATWYICAAGLHILYHLERTLNISAVLRSWGLYVRYSFFLSCTAQQSATHNHSTDALWQKKNKKLNITECFYKVQYRMHFFLIKNYFLNGISIYFDFGAGGESVWLPRSWFPGGGRWRGRGGSRSPAWWWAHGAHLARRWHRARRRTGAPSATL